MDLDLDQAERMLAGDPGGAAHAAEFLLGYTPGGRPPLMARAGTADEPQAATIPAILETLGVTNLDALLDLIEPLSAAEVAEEKLAREANMRKSKHDLFGPLAINDRVNRLRLLRTIRDQQPDLYEATRREIVNP
jgi:hypothetical protein